MSINDHARKTGSDLEMLANLISATESGIAPLPLHSASSIEVTYCVIKDTRAACASEFARHVSTLQEIAEGYKLALSLVTTPSTKGRPHHRATLHMPNERVAFTVLWVEQDDKDSKGA